MSNKQLSGSLGKNIRISRHLSDNKLNQSDYLQIGGWLCWIFIYVVMALIVYGLIWYLYVSK